MHLTASCKWTRWLAVAVLVLTLGLVPVVSASAAASDTRPAPGKPVSASTSPDDATIQWVYRDWYYLFIECQLQGLEGVEDGTWDNFICVPAGISPILSVWLLYTNR